MECFFRKSKIEDLDALLVIYAKARSYMASHGNPNQWGNTYPLKEDILMDIQKGFSYVYVNDNNHIYGVFALCEGIDVTYNKIYEGSWIKNEPYLTIHHLASSFEIPQFAQKVFSYAKERGLNLRADTHADNKSMQNALLKFGFAYCGKIMLLRGEERLAYEYINIKED